MATPALAFRSLVKDYGRVHALRGIDLEIPEGEVFGFLGPNGAGKSTAIRILLDLIRPTAGHAEVLGVDAQRQTVEARRLIGYLPSDPTFFPRLSALETFEYLGAVRGQEIDRTYRDQLIERLDLDAGRRVRDLSRGNRQKVGVVQALMARPRVVVLDEPTTGLDPLVQGEVEQILREVASDGRTVFFSSHVLAEVEQICSRAAILREGRIVDAFDLAEQRRLAPRRIEATLATPPPAGAFGNLPASVTVTRQDGARVSFETHDGVDAVVKALAQFEIIDLTSRQPTLEELFLDYYRAPEEVEP